MWLPIEIHILGSHIIEFVLIICIILLRLEQISKHREQSQEHSS
jgi:hypothetical protein